MLRSTKPVVAVCAVRTGCGKSQTSRRVGRILMDHGLSMVMCAGVDYEAILRRAETEADVIIWDGGNNDFSFFAPDLPLTVVDPLRPGHELRYHPDEVALGPRTHLP